ncbi:MAG: cytochrome c3 family protein [Deferribacterota bacterium]|nr:cytochrome c3 family protein [Deferribacterota bacterium]
MKKLILVLFIFCTFVYAGITASDATDNKSTTSPENLDLGPKEIDLTKSFDVKNITQKKVIFPHRFLQEALEYQCEQCHMSKKGGGALKNQNTGKELKISSIEGVANPLHTDFCWPCHTKMNVPQGRVCSKCHK